MEKTFKEFKEDFYNNFDNAEIFDCGDFNTIKIVLDGLKVNYTQYKRKPDFFFESWRLFRLLFLIKKFFIWNKKYKQQRTVLENKILRFQNKKYLIFSDNKLVNENNGKKSSLYFSRIIDDLLPVNSIFVGYSTESENLNTPFDVSNLEIVAASLYAEFNESELLLRNDLIKNYKYLKILKIFSEAELRNIKIAYVNFFKQYRIWNYFFKKLNLKSIIITAHYHKEGLVYAAKRNNIKVVELQHGLIANEDIFYVFPKKIENVIAKALFANFIFVYGKAWGDVLLNGSEYKPEQIKILGYYHAQVKYIFDSEFEKAIKNKKVALLTTQTFMEELFIDWIKKIANSIPDNFILIIKTHPNEDKKKYLLEIKEFKNVMLVDINLDALLSISDFNISCYSTTIFDAMRFNVKSFALNFISCIDYVNALVEKNLVVKLEPNQNVFDCLNLLDNIKIEQEEYYSDYNFKILKEILEN